MSDSFSSEVGQILDRLLDHERTERQAVESRKKRWQATIHDYRDLAGEIVVPILEKTAHALRQRGWQAYVTDNTRFGMTVALEVDRSGSHSRTLSFRLNAENRDVEALTLSPRGSIVAQVAPIDDVDPPWVERAVIGFLERLG